MATGPPIGSMRAGGRYGASARSSRSNPRSSDAYSRSMPPRSARTDCRAAERGRGARATRQLLARDDDSARPNARERAPPEPALCRSHRTQPHVQGDGTRHASHPHPAERCRRADRRRGPSSPHHRPGLVGSRPGPARTPGERRTTGEPSSEAHVLRPRRVRVLRGRMERTHRDILGCGSRSEGSGCTNNRTISTKYYEGRVLAGL